MSGSQDPDSGSAEGDEGKELHPLVCVRLLLRRRQRCKARSFRLQEIKKENANKPHI